jgi:hypothetical protein
MIESLETNTNTLILHGTKLQLSNNFKRAYGSLIFCQDPKKRGEILKLWPAGVKHKTIFIFHLSFIAGKYVDDKQFFGFVGDI